EDEPYKGRRAGDGRQSGAGRGAGPLAGQARRARGAGGARPRGARARGGGDPRGRRRGARAGRGRRRQARGAAQALVGPIALVVHNASTLGPVPLEPLADTDCETLEATLAVNLVGPFRLTKALVGAMMLHHRGLVVHVSSDAAVTPYARWGAYGVSKAALDHLNRIWAAELDGSGVDFLSIDPGEMDTAMHAAAMPDADRAALADPARVAERIVGLIERGGFASGARIEAQAGAAS